MSKTSPRSAMRIGALALGLALLSGFLSPARAQIIADDAALPFPAVTWDTTVPVPAASCARTITANVVALDQPYYWNRLGAYEPQGMIYALEHDVVATGQVDSNCTRLPLTAGNVRLRSDKRPRPLVLRMNVGDCLQINFKNLLSVAARDEEQPHTRAASIHVQGMQYVNSINDGGLNVGLNAGGGVIDPGQVTTYTLYAQAEGTFLMYSGGAMFGGNGDGGSISAGLFGAVNVQPKGARWYRSQVTETEFSFATTSTNAQGYPVINYEKTYTTLYNPYCFPTPATTPVLNMLGPANNILYSDLTAIIAGPSASYTFDETQVPRVGSNTTGHYPQRQQPYREFTIIFHDEVGAVQAFPVFEDATLSHTLHSVRDAFAINYGAAGAGAEVFANRLGVGPMTDCVECLYEEFFLTSWAVGDPAMVVDVPANAPCTVAQLKRGQNCVPTPGKKATRAYYPADPSNVYHSYLNDHVKFRNLHAGIEDHHIFHLHAHQWVHTPNTQNSSYHDSQAIGQGSAYTYEIAWGGSGNKNKTPGDSIFHCHFYPHFAQGMWGLWRVHDVLEKGTKIGADGRPTFLSSGTNITTTTRALPDGEIKYGTPIPGLVPLPGLPMAPVPANVTLFNGQYNGAPATNPGYPFFVPGIAGHRPPHPPLDTLDDGGLPRHVITALPSAVTLPPGSEAHTRHNFMKHPMNLTANFLPDAGTATENVAMTFHEQASHATFTPTGAAATFPTNGRPRTPGAPFADPCPAGSVSPRIYKAAVIQMDMVLNKVGWHFPQQRLITLWEDVKPTLAGTRPPEPFFFRAASNECIVFHHTNLTPNEYHLDDFQVRTPTDVISQHIHLVKFDVLASDGGGNGFNYEDGTFSAEEVHHRIEQIRAGNGCLGGVHGGDPLDNNIPGNNPLGPCPVIEAHPYFAGTGVDADCDTVNDWEGAQTTVQRWYADALDSNPVDDPYPAPRTLRTVFTHDHFGPSSHQQAGLYAGLIIEEAGSTWYHNESGVQLSTASSGRIDGGPTSWQARIVGANETFREFLLEFADFQLAYEPNRFGPQPDSALQISCPANPLGALPSYADNATAINPPNRKDVDGPKLFEKAQVCPVQTCDPDGPYFPSIEPLGALPLPCPEAVSAADPGFGVVNYRSEPIGLRVHNPSGFPSKQTLGDAGDLSFAYETRTDRAIPELNDAINPWVPYPPLTGGLFKGDPFTPLMRIYEGDAMKVRFLVGAHEEEHNFSINGMKWYFEPDWKDSGFRNSLMAGISEFFDLEIPRIPSLGTTLDGRFADYLYRPSISQDFQWNGIWGLIRAYRGLQANLPALPTNPDGAGMTNELLSGTTDQGVFATKPISQPTSDAPAPAPVPSDEVATGKAIGPNVFSPAPGGSLQPVACPAGAPIKHFEVAAIWATQGLPDRTLIYNSRATEVKHFEKAGGVDECRFDPSTTSWVTTGGDFGPLHDPTAIMFVRSQDLDINGQLKPSVKAEPLIIRANAGDCIELRLTNRIPNSYTDLWGHSSVPMIIEDFNANDVKPSLHVGLHPQLVTYDVRQSDGNNVGLNRAGWAQQTVPPGQSITYYWYAGDLVISGGVPTWRPIEYGTIGLTSSDPIKHSNKGAVGALIIEPAGASWSYDLEPVAAGAFDILRKTRAAATVNLPNGKSFREFVSIFHDNINLRYSSGENGGDPVKNLFVLKDATEAGQDGLNYRSEPLWFRNGWASETPMTYTRFFPQWDESMFDYWVGARPETPIFKAAPGAAGRFRVVHPAGDTQNQVWEVTGHIWQEEPYVNSSLALGHNVLSNGFPGSNWFGSRMGIGPSTHFDNLFGSLGGPWRINGENLYRTYVSWATDDGAWGILSNTGNPSTVTPASQDHD